MGSIRKPQPVKLISALIYKDESVLLRAEDLLKKHFGPVDFRSQALPFDYTDYYEKEFGKDLSRKFLSFEKLILPDSLARVKVITNNIENRLAAGSCRSINIDPGYLDLAKFVLASTKDFSHRIYIGRGIYAELTLSYHEKSFRPLEWTYPDYRTSDYIAILTKIREIYAGQLRK
jgi:hypothetical protein